MELKHFRLYEYNVVMVITTNGAGTNSLRFLCLEADQEGWRREGGSALLNCYPHFGARKVNFTAFSSRQLSRHLWHIGTRWRRSGEIYSLSSRRKFWFTARNEIPGGHLASNTPSPVKEVVVNRNHVAILQLLENGRPFYSAFALTFSRSLYTFQCAAKRQSVFV